MESNGTEITRLIDGFLATAREDPDARAAILIDDEEKETVVTRGQLHHWVAASARQFQMEGLQPGHVVILLLPDNLDLIISFWAVLWSGAVPAVIPTPSPRMDLALYRDRVQHLMGLAGADGLVIGSGWAESLEQYLEPMNQMLLIFGREALEGADWRELPGPVESSLDQLGMLQFSSGTTGMQKGVALSQRALLEHYYSILDAFGIQGDDRVISWLPLYHDMGMMSANLLPMLSGIPCVHLSTLSWVRNPALLLQAISKHRATLSWMPNFAFSHTVRSVRERDLRDLDLSSMRVLCNAAEPIHHHTIEQFMARFRSLGLADKVICTAYGMAENGAAVTASSPDRSVPIDWVDRRALQEENVARPLAPDAVGATPMVSSGHPVQGVEVKVVRSEEEAANEREVGQIWVKSAFQFDGYYRQPALTAKVLRAGWFRTGDLGYLADGELYVTGRENDLIIVAGKNIYPQDIEAIVNGVPTVRPGRVAAFGVVDLSLGTESPYVVYETKDDLDPEELAQMERQIRRQVLTELDVTLGDVRRVEKGWVLKSVSGKIARSANRAKYQQSFG